MALNLISTELAKTMTVNSQKTEMTASDIAPVAVVRSGAYGKEVNRFHSRLLRVSLALEESRAYWAHAASVMEGEDRVLRAFEGRWFGPKSMERVRQLLSDFSYRYDAYGAALEVLTQWQPRDPMVRQNICHWHLQLSDPMYRAFTGTYLEQRRDQGLSTINRDIVAQWVSENLSVQWASATVLRMATALITCATAAGVCKKAGKGRLLTYPKVAPVALAYWLYFLRGLRLEGTLLANPYFASVGLSAETLERYLRKLPGVKFGRMGDVYEFDWQHQDLVSWANAELGQEAKDGL